MKALTAFYSIVGGLVLVVFWIYTTQIKTEGQLPFWDIVDFANENQAETSQEQIDNNIANVPTPEQQPVIPTPTQPQPTVVPQPQPIVTPPPQPVVAAPPPPKKPLGPYNDGSYTASSQTPWGTIEIALIVKNGQWSNVRYLQIPDSPPSQYAVSYLAKQALQAQNQNIDGVSGATYTSDAFRDVLSQIVQQSKA